MASTYYDWHLSRSQSRMDQKELATDAIKISKYHYKDGLILDFMTPYGRQLTVLLDNDDTKRLKREILQLFPDDEVARLRVAMNGITKLAKQIGTDTGIPFYNEVIAGILDMAKSWSKIAEQAIEDSIKTTRIAALEHQLKHMKEAAHQLQGIQAWIPDKDMKQHCAKMLDKLTK